MTGGIQQSVTTQPAPGIEGDFCDANPRYSALAGPGGGVAGPNGALIGRFVWASYSTIDADGAPVAYNNFGSGPVAGFLSRLQQGLITTYLTSAGMLIPAGFMATPFSAGAFWVKNNGTTEAVPGQKCYANFADGKASFAAAGAPSGAVSTSWSISAQTASFAGSIANDVLTVTGAVTGTIYPGSVLSGTNVATGTMITSQLAGTPGGDGTYAVSIPEQTVASTTITAAYGLLTLTTVSSGNFGVGDTLTGATAGVTAGSTITQFITGTGGSGSTAAVTPSQTSSSGSQGNLTGATNVETSWYARSSGLAGELVKISNVPGLG